MRPYYEDEFACACGCGAAVVAGRRFVSGHNLKNLVRTAAHCQAISSGQRNAWRTKRERKALGSTRIDANGYRLVKTHHGEHRWEKEHILVIESAIGRKLRTGEQVHHINGVRTDNRPENLHLFESSSAHQKAERSVKRLVLALMESGHVVFDRASGEYRNA